MKDKKQKEIAKKNRGMVALIITSLLFFGLIASTSSDDLFTRNQFGIGVFFAWLIALALGIWVGNDD
jgi:hypothetical protein